ncbi:MAG TPA: FtsX-like permease family protein [Bacteroidia bacterium]|nr:FtsX-like permease family protein [Bacteroidia bacterium]
MNYSYYIGRRLTFNSRKSFSRLIIRIGIAGITISLAVMIVSVAILTGFKSEITNKVIGFGSHIQVKALDLNESIEARPINRFQEFLKLADSIPGIQHIQVFAQKPAIIKTETDVQGIVLKGVDTGYDWNFLKGVLVKGTVPDFSDSLAGEGIFISKLIADKLRLDTGDQVPLYFMQDPVRARGLYITGIFETGLEDFDKQMALVDIRHIRRLNGWNDSLVHGFEINLHDIKDMERMAGLIDGELPPDLKSYSARDLKPQIFDWLGLLDTNVIIIIVLMILVSCINMITALLVLIIERTNMIGILKALGSSDAGVQRIFIFKAAYLIGQGILLGNLVGIGFCFYQLKTRFITLDPESYYLGFVPINIELWHILAINAGAFAICLLAMLLPSLIVTRITPVKAIRFD